MAAQPAKSTAPVQATPVAKPASSSVIAYSDPAQSATTSSTGLPTPPNASQLSAIQSAITDVDQAVGSGQYGQAGLPVSEAISQIGSDLTASGLFSSSQVSEVQDYLDANGYGGSSGVLGQGGGGAPFLAETVGKGGPAAWASGALQALLGSATSSATPPTVGSGSSAGSSSTSTPANGGAGSSTSSSTNATDALLSSLVGDLLPTGTASDTGTVDDGSGTASDSVPYYAYMPAASTPASSGGGSSPLLALLLLGGAFGLGIWWYVKHEKHPEGAK